LQHFIRYTSAAALDARMTTLKMPAIKFDPARTRASDSQGVLLHEHPSLRGTKIPDYWREKWTIA
jgi:hypothetical protein